MYMWPTKSLNSKLGKLQYYLQRVGINSLLSRLSESALRDFLNTEVLEKYSFLFKQKADNTAPNGSDLETWLQKMLSQMQSSIETHVNSAMDGSSL